MARVIMGSVKKIIIEKEPSETNFGQGVFEFTDDYSVFDYGKMPDTIPGKGECLCRMSAYNFEQLAKRGITSHYRGMKGKNQMAFDVVRILHPGKDAITAKTGNYLVPLEVIFRNTLPAGSSVFRRLESGQLKPADIGLDHVPKPGEKLKKPIMDFSTKLEATDRYLDVAEAKKIAALTDKEFEALKQKALAVDEFLTQHAESLGIEHADGKVEFIMSPKRELLLGDVVGTMDENRFLYRGFHLSKQALRDYYLLSDWPAQVKKAFAENRELPKPKPLPKELVQIMGNMYKSVCEAWTGKRTWGAPKLGEVIGAYTAFMEKARKQ